GGGGGGPWVPPPHPTQAPARVAITGRSAVTSPPGDSSQPSGVWSTGSRLATATTGRSPSGRSVSRGAAAVAGIAVAEVNVVDVTAADSLIGVNRIVIGYPALLTRNGRR